MILTLDKILNLLKIAENGTQAKVYDQHLKQNINFELPEDIQFGSKQLVVWTLI